MQPRRRLLLTWVVGIIAASLIGFIALEHVSDRSVVPGKSADPNVVNGLAFERGVVYTPVGQKLVLPENAEVRRTGTAGRVEMFLAKRLAYWGHPGKRVTVEYDARTKMGCAMKAAPDVLTIATFGEWDSHIEGGADIKKLIAVVAYDVVVEKQDRLAGEHSLAVEPPEIALKRVKSTAEQDDWWENRDLAEGWTALATVADPKRTAE